MLRKAEQAVLGHSVVPAAARPRSVVRSLFSRYDGGMTYANHVDDALMGGQRTDVSFPLVVSVPESYEGGEPVIVDTAGERAMRTVAWRTARQGPLNPPPAGAGRAARRRRPAG